MLAENMEMWKAALIEEGETRGEDRGEARGEILGAAQERIKGILRNVRRDFISIDDARAEIMELQAEGTVPDALAADALARFAQLE